MSIKARLALWAAVIVLALLAVLFFARPAAQRLPAVPSMPAGGDFTLQSADGPVSLRDFRGKLVLIYFGYTFCPDVCPTSLASTAAGLKRLSAAELDKVVTLFVSVDTERDTPAMLKEYAAFFHPSIIGVTGEKAAVAEIAGRYGVIYARQNLTASGEAYVIDHTSETYVIDAAGTLREKIPHAAPADQVAATLRRFLP